jgi:hypothetical protein
MKLLGLIALVLGILWVLAATVIPTGGTPRFLPRVWDLVAKRRMVVAAVVVALLAVPFARYEWRVRDANCTTVNLAVDFNSSEAAEAWSKTVRDAEAYCRSGQWDRSKLDMTKI